MTDTEKKMKAYLRAVERRLNLPRDVRTRVMSDFASSLEARRESGMTDDQIYAELGAAKSAAAELNEQMKEYTYQKSSWRFLFALLAVYGGVKLLGGLWVNIIYWFYRMQAMLTPNEATSIGIIGGADGPTAIFLTTPIWISYLVPAAMLVVGVWGYLRLRRCKQ